MTINKMKATTFDEVSFTEWKEVAVKSLRGLPFEKLITKTIEGIQIAPLYIDEGLVPHPTIRRAKASADWIVAQPHHAVDANSYVIELDESLQRGNEAIVYDGSNPFVWHEETLKKLAQLVVNYPVFMTNVSENDGIFGAFLRLPQEDYEKVRGTVDTVAPEKLQDFPNIRTIVADIRPAHHKGADAVTELALALAIAAEHAKDYASFEQFNQAFYVRFAIDTHFFMEIAKIRAFRVLWEAFSSAYGSSTAPHIPILSETSLRSYSKLDPYVNLLRAGNEAFSAVLGGTDVLTVHPHNILTKATPTSLRLARNVQLVIKEETLVAEVLDPAGGSFYIEKLTNELIEKAWQRFLDIETLGGYSSYKQSGTYINHLEKQQTKRKEAVARGFASLIGTNAYADISEEVEKSSEITGEDRLSSQFELFRERFKENAPTVKLLTFGQLKDFKPRADFASSYLATGGLKSDWSPAFSSVEEALQWLQTTSYDYLIICASDEQVKQVLSKLLKNKQSKIIIDVAGKVDEERSKEWKSLGLDGYLFKGQNKIEKFTELFNRWKGVNHYE